MQKNLVVFLHLQCPCFSGMLLCTLNLNKVAFISNGELVSFSRETEKIGDFLSFCRLLTCARFGCSSLAIVMRAMKFRTCIARHIVKQRAKFQHEMELEIQQ